MFFISKIFLFLDTKKPHSKSTTKTVPVPNVSVTVWDFASQEV